MTFGFQGTTYGDTGYAGSRKRVLASHIDFRSLIPTLANRELMLWSERCSSQAYHLFARFDSELTADGITVTLIAPLSLNKVAFGQMCLN
jgi:hypothetical protein